MLRKSLAWTLKASAFALTYVVNPAYLTACGDSAEDEQDARAEAELLANLDEFQEVEAWMFVSKHGESYELKFQLTQSRGDDVGEVSRAASLMNTAHACGNRTFFQSASACATLYELALEGTLSVRRVDSDEPVVSDLPVEGRLTNYGELWLNIDGSTEDVVRFSRSVDDGYALADFAARDLGPEELDLMSEAP